VTLRRKAALRKSIAEFAPIYVDGKLLTIPEAKIFKALTDLKIPFQAQKVIGRQRELGGAVADFWLPSRGIILEYQGVFHKTDEGAARDFFRAASRAQFGAIDVIPIYDTDLPRIHDRLLELLGKSSLSSMYRR
jgi:hypothetical protein